MRDGGDFKDNKRGRDFKSLERREPSFDRRDPSKNKRKDSTARFEERKFGPRGSRPNRKER
jgi:hypothetical protein